VCRAICIIAVVDTAVSSNGIDPFRITNLTCHAVSILAVVDTATSGNCKDSYGMTLK
jgi:hypothetical protein